MLLEYLRQSCMLGATRPLNNVVACIKDLRNTHLYNPNAYILCEIVP